MASIINASSSGSGGIVQTADASGVLQLQSNGTTALTVSGATVTLAGATTLSNTLQVATTIGVGGATPAASGAGITFPATQSASTNANTLDDYEEGTFTPAIVGSVSNPTVVYAGRTGQYTRIGNIVNWTIYIGVSTISGGSGTAIVSGFPFVVGGNVGYAMSNGWYNNGVTGLSANQTYPVQYVTPGQTLMQLNIGSSGTSFWLVTTLGISNIAANFEIRISGCYEAV
jgi:hypothetical protein